MQLDSLRAIAHARAFTLPHLPSVSSGLIRLNRQALNGGSDDPPIARIAYLDCLRPPKLRGIRKITHQARNERHPILALQRASSWIWWG